MEVFPFDAELRLGDDDAKKAILGGKGANLNTMVTELNMPVPPGFTISTDACFIHEGAGSLVQSLYNKVVKQVGELEVLTGKKFGAKAKMPLLLSVRSGAPVSMPGMMDTILNLGLNAPTTGALARRTNDRFAWDSYRRFVQMYAMTAMDAPKELFDKVDASVDEFFAGQDVAERHMLAVESYGRALEDFGILVPTDPWEQLAGAILAVFRSWNSDRAKTYREIEGIPDNLGTAVNVQAMVFGNMNDASGTGVAFTRNPNTGANERFGDFLVNAQGEDVVAGLAATRPLADMHSVFPEQAAQLEDIMVRLEQHYRDMCDIEFTIEDGQLYMLQTRIGKRNSKASVGIALDFMAEGVITKAEAQARIETAMSKASGIQTVTVSTDKPLTLLGTATPASPGEVEGRAVFNSKDAVAAKAAGEDVILIRHETSPDDIDGMAASVGILTSVGGLVSHAAVVARAWEKPCVVGMAGLILNGDEARIGENVIDPGTIIRINGTTGDVHLVGGNEDK